MRRFIKDFEKRVQSDGQRTVFVPAGTKAEVEEYADGCFLVQTEKPCTKNGERELDLSQADVEEYLSH